MSTIARRLAPFLAIATVGILGIAALPAHAQTKLNLKLNSQWPATTAGSKVDQWFADEVRKRTSSGTGGAIDIRIFWSEALGKANENLRLMQTGAIEMAAMSPSYFPAELPFHTAPNSIPMAMTTVAQASVLMPRLLKEVPAFTEEAKANGVRALFFHHLNPYLLVSKEPLTTVAALSGKKIRTWGTDMPRMAQAVGMTPVTLSLPEIYESLSRGVVDAAPFSVDLVVNYKIFEVAKNVSEVTLWLGPSWAVWIADSVWQKLTPAQQQVVDDGRQRGAPARSRRHARRRARRAHRTREARREVHRRSRAEESAKWRAALPDFFADFIAARDKQGKGADARKMIDGLAQRRRDHQVTHPLDLARGRHPNRRAACGTRDRRDDVRRRGRCHADPVWLPARGRVRTHRVADGRVRLPRDRTGPAQRPAYPRRHRVARRRAAHARGARYDREFVVVRALRCDRVLRLA